MNVSILNKIITARGREFVIMSAEVRYDIENNCDVFGALLVENETSAIGVAIKFDENFPDTAGGLLARITNMAIEHLDKEAL